MVQNPHNSTTNSVAHRRKTRQAAVIQRNNFRHRLLKSLKNDTASTVELQKAIIFLLTELEIK